MIMRQAGGEFEAKPKPESPKPYRRQNIRFGQPARSSRRGLAKVETGLRQFGAALSSKHGVELVRAVQIEHVDAAGLRVEGTAPQSDDCCCFEISTPRSSRTRS
jgi:hypothetical protein